MMKIATLDLEGVLVPEIWISFADAAKIPALCRTTRDEPDYDKLMHYRLEILSRKGIKLSDIQAVIDTIEPLEGAKEFLDWLREKTRVVILSDTFEQFAAPLMRKLGNPVLFCHEIETDADGFVSGYKLRLGDQKRKTVEAFRSLNFKVVSAGDSYNDLSMLRAADRAVLYRPTPAFASENSDLPAVFDYAGLKAEFDKFLKE